MIDAASKRERVKPFQAYRLGSYPMNNITSVICCFITRFGKKNRVVVIDSTIQKMQTSCLLCSNADWSTPASHRTGPCQDD